MNIKSLFKSQRTRHFILKSLSWLPDKIMLPIQYWAVLKRWPNLKTPKRFTEWIQVYKMCYRNKIILQCVDKYEVRDFVSNRLDGNDYLNELYQICSQGEEIDFDSLPDKFVIKTTDGGNGDNVLIVRDKSKLNIPETINKINLWRNKKYYTVSREWAYTGAKDSRIIVEKLLENPNDINGSIEDYKFLCFNGKFKYLWVDKGRFVDHRRGFWNQDLIFLDGIESDHPTFRHPSPLPSNINDMINIAESLSHGFPFVRVDLYNLSGKIVFGEMTFYPWSGYVQFNPDSFDFMLGREFNKDGW